MKRIVFVIVMILIWLVASTASAEVNNIKLLSLIHNGANNYFEFITAPGETVCFEFELQNVGEETITNHLLIYDSLTAVNGGNIIMSPAKYIAEGAASWFSMNEKKVVLESGCKEVHQVSFSIPPGTVPGEYTAIIALYSDRHTYDEQRAAGEEEVGIRINRHYTSTLAVVIRVGDNPERRIGFSDEVEFIIKEDNGKSFIYVPVTNKGYTYEFPEISIMIHDSKGEILFCDGLTMDIVYMKTEAYACLETTGGMTKPGDYNLSAIMQDSATGEFIDEKEFVFSIETEDVKKAVAEQASAERKAEAGWDDSFFVFEKKHMYLAGGISAMVILTLLSLLLIKRTR